MHGTAFLAAAAPAKQAAAAVGWNWSVFLGAIAGGLIGAGIPAVMTMAGWGRERARRPEEAPWADDEVIADVKRLLQEIDPIRRGAKVHPGPAAEEAARANLKQPSNHHSEP